MHILTIPNNIGSPIPVFDGRSLEPGKEYLCANRFVGQMFNSEWRVLVNKKMWAARSLIKARPWDPQPFDPGIKDIWIYRGGGWGDLLMLTPVLKELREKYSDSKIHLSCGDAFHGLFNGLNFLKLSLEQIPMPYTTDVATSQIVSLEDLIEGDPEAERVHISQLFANKFCIKLNNIKPLYKTSSDEFDFAYKNYPRRKNTKRIGIQFLASALYRSHPRMGEVVKELARDYEVFLFGAPGQLSLKSPIDKVFNLMDDGLGFRQSAAVLSTCDACVAPDSAMVHLSSALDIPCVALYGPFPATLRISSPKAIALQGRAECAPCFFHATNATDFPAGMPCYKPGRCVAMESIPVEKIVQSVKEVL